MAVQKQSGSTAPKKRGGARPWRPGESGNPAGRRPGTGEVAKLRAAISEHVPAIIAAMVDAAKGGDSAAARLLMERCIAPLRATDQPAPVALPGTTLTAQARAVLLAAADGALTPSEAVQYLTGIGAAARVIEVDELASRVAALESKQPTDHVKDLL